MEILQWIMDNHHWLFDGFGALVVMAVLGWVVGLFKRGGRKSPGQSQKIFGGSTGIQAGRDANVGNGKTERRSK
jgi:hypothetical protein